MRLVLAMVLAGLAAFPLSVSAQTEESEEAPKQAVEQEPASPAEPSAEEPVQRWHPEAFVDPSAPEEPGLSSEPAPEEPALKLELDQAGVWVVTDRQKLKEMERMERRVKRAKVGLGVTPVPIVIGLALGASAWTLSMEGICVLGDCPPRTAEELAREERLARAGVTIGVLGGMAMIATGILLGVRKRKLRELQQAHYGTRRRVQWDLEQSRLRF